MRIRRVALIFIVSLMILAAGKTIGGTSPSTVREREVEFRSDGVKLIGTLLLPGGPAPYPAVVLVHGSGPSPKSFLRLYAERFARIGFAALIYDKRGTGGSGGSWVEASLDDLAQDALSAAAFLKAQPEVEARCVGAWGISQGGWVIPRAVARAPQAFDFAMVITGGGLKPIDVERNDYGAALDAMRATPDERREAMELVEQYFAYLRTGQGRSSLVQAIEAARGKPWFKAVDVGRVLPSETGRGKWAWVAEYDPMSDAQSMRMPVLVVLGGQDRPALSAEWNQRWRTALVENRDATIVEFLGAGHGATIAGTHHMGGAPPSFVPGFLEIVDDWLRAHCTRESVPR